MIVNLDQIRARNALNAITALGNNRGPWMAAHDGDIVSGLPNRILNHGLLAMLVYARSKVVDLNELGGYGNTFNAIAVHLSDH